MVFLLESELAGQLEPTYQCDPSLYAMIMDLAFAHSPSSWMGYDYFIFFFFKLKLNFFNLH